MNIQIKLLTTDAMIPTRGSDFAAGYDLYTTDRYELKPGERYLYKTGISTAMPNGYYGRIAPRSGLAYKKGIDVMAGVVDSDYRGEIGVLLVNLSTENWLPEFGKPIAQMIFEQHSEVYFDVVDILPESNRGTSGLGHKDTTTKKQTPSDPRKAPIKTSVNIVERWKEAGDDIPIPQKYESVAREREKLIP
jgi:dUTP pyrophosphatase